MMFDYPAYADFIGSSMKTLWGPLMPEKQHREAFNALIDAKVNLNKSIYNASKEFVENINAVAKSTQPK